MRKTAEERAAYQRLYRARVKTALVGLGETEDTLAAARAIVGKRKVVDLATVPGRIEASFDMVTAELRIAELEAEVARLRHELAAPMRKTHAQVVNVGSQFNSRPFTPVPKK